MEADLFKTGFVYAHAGTGGVIRSLDVIMDLRWLHSCLKDPRLLTNKTLDRKESRLALHYMRLLATSNAHAYVYTIDQDPIVQLELIPFPMAGLDSDVEFRDAYVMYFRFSPGRRENTDQLIDALRLAALMVFQFMPGSRLVLPIPKGNFIEEKVAVAAGFVPIESAASLQVEYFRFLAGNYLGTT
ncbi:hypothetical protein [Flavihumibacter solisilvae]|uniref:Uncharacterized protein n=1 Tax=Flavihumibacter solisilvae TaxID=1349421 RepID=A0A0C1KXL5_9BACT|nr:hypothetical protein [Flavihumibacter solisilvae]KIC91996.1 hypothetical protein OI18_21985 [Flavihumibacter solisilvae]